MTSRRIAVVGAGPAGTALAIGLLRSGHDVTLVSDRTTEEIREGSVMSSQVTFESALEVESALGIAELLPPAPPLGRMSYAVERSDGSGSEFSTELATPARSLDQRVRLPLLIDEVERLGGKVVTRVAAVEDLDDLAADHDLVVASTGRGGLASLFAVDESRSPYTSPQRVAALTYLRGVTPDPAGPGLRYRSVEGVGECFTCPALTVDGPCDIFVVEGVPGGPLDAWDDASTPQTHLARLQELLDEHFPAEASRIRDASLVDDRAMMQGQITPVVRRPVGVLPSGAPVLGMADVVVLNDPLTSQGSNNATKSASFYLEAINAHEGDFDAAWMQRTFDNFWRGWAQWATEWTNSWLRDAAPHQREVVDAAGRHPSVAQQIVAGFDDARLFSPWWFDPAETAAFLARQRAADSSRFDARDLRRALGQYATGVTVVTTTDPAGLPFGMTANSFTSVSLDPPLVLWAAAKSSPSLAAFETNDRFAVNVLASDQHHLSRQFATTGAEKFEGVRLTDGDLPLLTGTVAHFVCRRRAGAEGRIDAGDHVLFIGEIESYSAPGGEPLVFHSGFYRVATRHPDL
jgi:flavin reductase (DIM6/NTAB) family NADH-FMN oxidoreductase RutF